MSEQSERLLKVIVDSKLSYAELENRTGIAKSSIQRYARGTTKKIPAEAVNQIAKATNSSASWIMGISNAPIPQTNKSNNIEVPMKINIKLKERRKELGLTMLEVAKKVGVSEATVSRWESGDIANMRRDKIVLLAKALNVHPDFIMDEKTKGDTVINTPFPEPEITEDVTTFPVIGEVAAGYESIADENWMGETVEIPNQYLCGHNQADFFVLKVKGDSMIPLYHEGDKVLILKQSTMNYSGQIGVVIYGDDKGTLKRVEYAQGEDWMRLVPLNLNHPVVKIEN